PFPYTTLFRSRRAEQVAFDPSDPDFEPGGRRNLGNLVGDEPVADRAVEHEQSHEEKRAETDDDAQYPLAHAARPLGRSVFREVLFFRRHQKACPSETYTPT